MRLAVYHDAQHAADHLKQTWELGPILPMRAGRRSILSVSQEFRTEHESKAIPHHSLGRSRCGFCHSRGAVKSIGLSYGIGHRQPSGRGRRERQAGIGCRETGWSHDPAAVEGRLRGAQPVWQLRPLELPHRPTEVPRSARPFRLRGRLRAGLAGGAQLDWSHTERHKRTLGNPLPPGRRAPRPR